MHESLKISQATDMFIKYLLNLKHVNLDQLNWSLELHDNLITPLHPPTIKALHWTWGEKIV